MKIENRINAADDDDAKTFMQVLDDVLLAVRAAHDKLGKDPESVHHAIILLGVNDRVMFAVRGHDKDTTDYAVETITQAVAASGLPRPSNEYLAQAAKERVSDGGAYHVTPKDLPQLGQLLDKVDDWYQDALKREGKDAQAIFLFATPATRHFFMIGAGLDLVESVFDDTLQTITQTLHEKPEGNA